MDLSDPAVVENLLWLVVGIIIGIYVIAFARRGIKGNLKQFNYAAALIFFGLCFGSLRRLIIKDNIYMIFTSNLVLAIFCIPLMKYLEEQILQHKKLYLSYTTIVLVVVYIAAVLITNFENRNLMNWLILLPYILEIGTIFYVYAYMIKNTTGIIQKSSLLILIGLLVAIAAWMLHAQFGRNGTTPKEGLMNILGIVSPLSILIGLSIAALGFFKYRPSA